jgi:hypothetical protein
MNEQRTTSRAISISQIVSNLGVIGSLVFVGLQVRQNTRVERLTNQREMAYLDNSVFDPILNSLDMPRIILQADSDVSKLTPEQKMRYDSFAARRFNLHSLSYAQYRSGFLDPDVYKATEAGLVYALKNFHASQVFWKENKANYPARFAAYVDSIIGTLPK